MVGKRGTNMAMPAPRPRKPRPPLNERSLEELALFYLGRFATTRSKLRAYLARKVRERGWGGAAEPQLADLAERLAGQGYIDDAGFALSKAQALVSRGYGTRRLTEKLRAAGVDEEDAAGAREFSRAEAVAAAVRFAERRRLGPFASAAALDPKHREKAIGAFVRAGHSFALARALTAMPPGAPIDVDELTEGTRFAAT